MMTQAGDEQGRMKRREGAGVDGARSDGVRILAVGDVILQRPDPDAFFEPSAAVLRSAPVVIGQIEVPHTTSQETAALTIPAPPADPEALQAMARAGFTIGTTAGNHTYDAGRQGVLDTLAAARRAGLEVTGSGADLAEATRPAIVTAGGLRIGVLSYNCVGPRESWATSAKAGAAYVKVITHYELDDLNPGNPPQIYTFCDRPSLEALRDAVAALRAEVDVVVVALHKGLGHTPALLADYEREVSHAAVDAGAGAVIGHHAHIMRGIEMYRGAAIFHGLGNFVSVTDALTPGAGGESEELERWARRRREVYGFSPDPAMPHYPFHPESRNTAIAVLDVSADGTVLPGFIPCWIDDGARPVPLPRSEEGEEVAEYIRGISERAGLDAAFRWEGDVVRIAAIENHQTS